ncbi:MAG: hypothetical protein OEV76_09385, partial [Anaerolineae bacterium]|nr:hypothetical protein [Anaerolineae bacterium]
MSRYFFQGVYWGLVVVASGIRVVYTARYRKTAHARGPSTGLDALLTGLPALGMFILPLIYTLTPWLDFADYRLPAWAGWIGVA